MLLCCPKLVHLDHHKALGLVLHHHIEPSEYQFLVLRQLLHLLVQEECRGCQFLLAILQHSYQDKQRLRPKLVLSLIHI